MYEDKLMVTGIFSIKDHAEIEVLCYLLLKCVDFFSLILLFTKGLPFSSVTQSCPTLCDPMDCNMPGLPVHHELPVYCYRVAALSKSLSNNFSTLYELNPILHLCVAPENPDPCYGFCKHQPITSQSSY